MDPATLMLIAQSAPAIMQKIAPYIEKALPFVSNYLGENQDLKTAQAYQDYLNNFSSGMADTLQGRATDYENKLGSMADTAESQYLGEANTPLAELGQMQSDIANQSAEAQRQNRLQIQNQLNTSGVRGGQASILQNRATGELNRDLQRDVNSLAYDEASNRQNSRLGYYGAKAITPWSDLSSTYGANSRSASSSLSGAQGLALKNAYDTALSNYKNTLRSGNSLSGMSSLFSR